MPVSNPIRFIDVGELDTPSQAEFDALESNFDAAFQSLPNIYAPLTHSHSEYALTGHGHTGFAPVSHVHSLGVFDRPGGVDRWRSYITTTSAGPYLLTCDSRVKYLHWTAGATFAIRVDNTWFYLPHSASDERIKKNIKRKSSPEDLAACLNVFNGIQLIEFDWDTDASTVVPEGHVDLGFSAQNLASVKPEFVIQPTADDVAQINVSALLHYLVGAIQGLQLEVDTLKAALGFD